ncbi:hypothetical protein QLX67_11530 [Balneolaceae bacterium ANBcel3]|nr:hypothetical protein [Balneolaceae bacterium ANBcel3]
MPFRAVIAGLTRNLPAQGKTEPGVTIGAVVAVGAAYGGLGDGARFRGIADQVRNDSRGCTDSWGYSVSAWIEATDR